MARSSALKVGQIGVESAWGTPVAQTSKLPNLEEISIQPEPVIERKSRLGDKASGVRVVATSTSGTATVSGGASYGVIGLWCQGIFGAATDAGASPYTHTWEPDTATDITPKFYTLVANDGTDALALLGALVSEYKLSVSPEGEATETVSFVGKYADDIAPTGSLSDFTDGDQPILPSELTVYLDAIGSAGTTSLACSALKLELTIKPTISLRDGLGTVEKCNYVVTSYDIMISLTGEADNATIKTHVESLLGTTPTPTQLDMQLSFSKSASYAQTLIIPCHLSAAPKWHEDDDGALVFAMDFASIKSSSSSATNGFLDWVLTNEDAAI